MVGRHSASYRAVIAVAAPVWLRAGRPVQAKIAEINAPAEQRHSDAVPLCYDLSIREDSVVDESSGNDTIHRLGVGAGAVTNTELHPGIVAYGAGAHGLGDVCAGLGRSIVQVSDQEPLVPGGARAGVVRSGDEKPLVETVVSEIG